MSGAYKVSAPPAPTEDTFCGACGGPVAGGRCAYCRRSPEEAAEAAILDPAAGAPARAPEDAVEEPSRSKKPRKQGRALELEDPEPWPEPVDGAAVLDDIAAVIRRHVELPAEAADAAALYVAFTYCVEGSDIAPMFVVGSPTLRCGKTTLLRILAAMVRRPLPAGNVTPAAIFRVIEQAAPTLLIDEADTFLKMSEELRGLLNAAHTRDMAFVVRTVGEDYEPRRFSTFGAKIVALIGRLPPTLEDRAIRVEMSRRRPAATIAPVDGEELAVAEPIRRKLMAWPIDLRRYRPGRLVGLDDRGNDNWRPLFAIAEAAGGSWPDRARRAAVTLSVGRNDEESVGVLLLCHVRDAFGDRERLTTVELLAALCDREEGPWAAWWGDGVEAGKTRGPASRLARLLRAFEIKPRDIRTAQGILKGYLRADFQDAWDRYVDSSGDAVPPLPPTEERDNATLLVDGQIQTRQADSEADSVSRSETASDQRCRVVASLSGGEGERGVQESLPVVPASAITDPPERGVAYARQRINAGESNLFIIARDMNGRGFRQTNGRPWTAAALKAALDEEEASG